MDYIEYDIYQLKIPAIVCLYTIGGIDSNELEKVSEYMLNLGADSQYLVDILLSQDLTSDELTAIFEKAINDLGYVIPSETEAAISLSKKIAMEILSGAKTPYQGAMFIWKNIINHIDDIPDDLWLFKSYASAIEDILSHVKNYVAVGDASDYDKLIQTSEQEILKAAKKLCDTTKSD
ncbi:MAG: hypothetical protein P8178_06350 [Candidatus Thiodiazotropha sp.]